MPKLMFFGVPAHPFLNDWPSTMLPASLICDSIAMMGGGTSWARSGYHALMAGCAGAALAGAVGALDYADVMSGPAAATDDDMRSSANTHAALNAGVGGLFGFLLWQRSQNPELVTPLQMALNAVGNLALFYSAWNGGNLVYRHGVRVEKEPASRPVELKRAAG